MEKIKPINASNIIR